MTATHSRSRHALAACLGAVILLLASASAALATDVNIGFLAGGACADDGTDAISFSVSTDRSGASAEHPQIVVEWRPEGTDVDSWATLATGALTSANGYTFASTVSGLDFTGLTHVEVRATASAAHTWGDGRAAGDSYSSTFAVDHCDDPGENARVNFTAGCQNASGEPEILLYNDGVLGVDGDVTFTVVAEVQGLTMERTVTVGPEDQTAVALVFTDADGIAFETEDTVIGVQVYVGDAVEYELDLAVDCHDDATPTASITSSCLDDGRGLVEVVLSNPTGAPVDFAVVVDGDVVGTRTVPAGGTSTESHVVDDAAGDLVGVVVDADGSTVASTTVELDCDPEVEDARVEISTECDVAGNLVVVEVTNGADEQDVVVTVDGAVVADDTLLADEVRTITTALPEDGRYEVVVVTGTTTLVEDVVVDCAEVLNERLSREDPPAVAGIGGTLPNTGFSTIGWLLIAMLLTFFGGDLVLTTLYRRWERTHG